MTQKMLVLLNVDVDRFTDTLIKCTDMKQKNKKKKEWKELWEVGTVC